jgi:hypothetical protein
MSRFEIRRGTERGTMRNGWLDASFSAKHVDSRMRPPD